MRRRGSGTGLYVSLNCEYSVGVGGDGGAVAGERGRRRVHGDGAGFELPGERGDGEHVAGAGVAGVQRADVGEPGAVVVAGVLGAGDVRRLAGRAGRAGVSWAGRLRRCSPRRTGRRGRRTSWRARRRRRRPRRWRRRRAARCRPGDGGRGEPGRAGVSADTAGDPVDTENGDFTQSDTDLSRPDVRAVAGLHPDL